MIFMLMLAAASTALSPADAQAAFKAAGFSQQGSQWRACEDPGTASYTPGAIETISDFNGDGRPEAIVTEGSLYCYGNQGAGFAVVSKQADGSWKKIADGSGIPDFLATKGTDGWADMQIGGPGFCFPVMRWNGEDYVVHRHEYEGKACKP
jgi:hypothetical protein